MLYLIGLGLGDAKDITVRGLEIVKSADQVYLENYTSILVGSDNHELEKFYGRSVTLADREMLEQGCESILNVAEKGSAAVLVIGDPLNATTHTDLLLRAASRNIPYQIIHNASILNAVACCGLQIYSFGETISIPFFTDAWRPESFFDKILRNLKDGLHTLCLLDIKVKEPDYDALIRGIKRLEPPRFMSVSQAAEQLIYIVQKRRIEKEKDSQANVEEILNEKTICMGLARVGSSTQTVIKTTLIEATKLDFGHPLHSLVIPGKMHPLEEEMTQLFSK